MKMSSWFTLAVILLSSLRASAQSSPNLSYGQVPSAAQWNSYFSAKQDVLVASPFSVLGNPGPSSLSPVFLTVPNCNGANQAITFTDDSGFGCNTFPAGNVTGPGTANVGYIPTWGNTGATLLASGLPVGTGGVSTVVETTAGGLLSLSIIPQITTAQVPTGKSVVDPGTGVLESVLPIQTSTGASKTFATADLQKKTRRSNSGASMTDTFPASTTGGLANGALINVANADATATDTITAGSGTSICGVGSCGSTFVITAGRDVWWSYDLANTAWRPVANTATALLGPNNLSDVTSAATSRTNLGLGTAAVANTGTSGATIPLNNGNNTSSGNQTHTGTENFTGTLEIGGAAVTLPVPVAIGGTASTNVSDALQIFSGVLNASACGKSQAPSWCSGSDVGAWINSAIAYTISQGWYRPKIILDPTSTYNQTTQITKPVNVALDCQGSNLVWQYTSGVALATGTVGGGVSNIGGAANCILSTSAGWATGHTNIGIYSGGDPAGVINAVDATDANDVYTNFQVFGFKYAYTHGNNSWSAEIMFPVFSGNYDGIYGYPVKFGSVTAFSISSNVVTVTVTNSFSVGDVINITGLSTGTYLNKVPLTVATVSGTQFTANFTHANVSTTSDTGQAYDGFYNAGEPSEIYGGSISNNANCGAEINYEPDEWHVFSTHFDYNTNQGICGGGPNFSLHGAYFEQYNGPLIKHSGTNSAMFIRMHGGQMTLTGTGTDTGLIQTATNSDTASVYSTIMDSNHAVSNIIYTNSGSNVSECLFDFIYAPGSTAPTNVSDATSPYCRINAGFITYPSSSIPYRAETYAANGEHIDAPSLSSTNYFCNQISYIARTDIAPNAQWCIYHGAGGGDTDKFALGMLGRNAVITMDANGVIGMAGSNLTASSPLFLDANLNLTNNGSLPISDLASVAGGTVIGNVSGTSASPTATANPVLGVNGTTTGKLGLANGGSSGATTTLQPGAVTSAASITLPVGSGTLQESAGCTVASASTVDLGASGCGPGSFVTVTGTTTVNSLGSTAIVGSIYHVQFTGNLTITNGASLVLPKATSITTGTGSPIFDAIEVSSGVWYVTNPTYNANIDMTPNGTVNTAGNLIGATVSVTGSTAPANGSYLPATNTLGFASNSTAAGTIDSTQHWRLGGTGSPTIGSNACGSSTQGTIGAGSTDRSGLVTVGTASVTSCVISFASTWGTAPRAVILTPANAAAAATGTTLAYVSAVGTTSFTITGTALAGAAYYYFAE